jgi:prepilin-type N-terminal cleavage/methylation domain-containing protein
MSGLRSKKREPMGFTLAEVLVALAIFSLAVVLVSSGIERGAAVWSHTQTSMSRGETVAAIHRVLGDLSLRAYPAAMLDTMGSGKRASGDHRGFSFAAEFPAHPDQAGYYLVDLRLEESSQGYDLILRRHQKERSSDVRGPSGLARNSVIATNLTEASFSYLSRSMQTGAYQWQDEWTESSNLPYLLKLTFMLDDEFHEVHIHFPGQVSPKCAIRPDSAGCWQI